MATIWTGWDGNETQSQNGRFRRHVLPGRAHFDHDSVSWPAPRSASGMSLRSPRSLTGAAARDPSPLAYEIAQQKALTLGRVGARFERALEALREFDEATRRSGGDGGDRGRRPHPAPRRDRLRGPEPGGAGAGREELLADAAEALWCYVVQREVCGFSGVEWILREYEVPREVHLRMGPRAAR